MTANLSTVGTTAARTPFPSIVSVVVVLERRSTRQPACTLRTAADRTNGAASGENGKEGRRRQPSRPRLVGLSASQDSRVTDGAGVLRRGDWEKIWSQETARPHDAVPEKPVEEEE